MANQDAGQSELRDRTASQGLAWGERDPRLPPQHGHRAGHPARDPTVTRTTASGASLRPSRPGPGRRRRSPAWSRSTRSGCRAAPVDFHDLIDRVVPPTAVRRFAFDENARIMPSGAIWTVDSPHAEIATPPRDLRAGIASRLARDALAERAALRRRLPAGAELRGYSTHLNAFAHRRRRLGPGETTSRRSTRRRSC